MNTSTRESVAEELARLGDRYADRGRGRCDLAWRSREASMHDYRAAVHFYESALALGTDCTGSQRAAKRVGECRRWAEEAAASLPPAEEV